MQIPFSLRGALIGLAALVGIVLTSAITSPAFAESGHISIRVVKGGWIIGASGGSGVLTFHGRRYPLSIGGLSAGFVFGASETRLHGTVSHIRRASDVTGVYGAAGGGAAVGVGARAIVLRNEKGAILTLSGRQAGLMVNADLSGLSITVR